MFAYDPVDLMIALTLVILAIVLAVAVGKRPRRRAGERRTLRRELDRMSARITALEMAEWRHLLTKNEPAASAPDAPSVPDNVADATPVPPAVAVSSRGPYITQMRPRHLEAAMLITVGAMLFLLAIVGLGAMIDEVPVSSGVGPPRR
jgi:hypothetical protein